MKILRTGLALGGGGSRGFAHIGVLEVLEETGIPVDMIAGTSIGATIGGVYLLEGKAANLRQRMTGFIESDAFKEAGFEVLREKKDDEYIGVFDSMAQTFRRGWMYSHSLTRQSIVSKETFFEINDRLFGEKLIEDLSRPFSAVSLDITTATEYIWSKGPLRDAVMASSAIPGFFPPVELNGRILVDGGWTNSVPVRPARSLGADFIIAVDTSRDRETPCEFKRGVDLMLRTVFIMMKTLRELQLEEADVVIQPQVMDIHWADFRNPDQLVESGRKAAIAALPQIRRLMRISRIKKMILPRRFSLGPRKSL
jgi:NTE family protein